MQHFQKIELYKQREFGDLFNVVFVFLRQNFGPLIKSLFFINLPIVLLLMLVIGTVQGDVLSKFFGEMWNLDSETNVDGLVDDFYGKWIVSNLGTVFLGMLFFVMVSLSLLAYLKLYQESDMDERPIITPSMVWAAVRTRIWTALGGTVLAYLAFIVGLFLCVLPGIFIGVSFCLFLPIVVMEGKSGVDALGRSYELVKGNWWFTFGFGLLIYMLSSFLASTIYVPAYIAFLLSFAFGMEEDPQMMMQTVQQNITWIMITVYGVAYTGGIITTSITQTALAFQYGNLIEQKEAKGLNMEIERSMGTAESPEANQE